MKSVLQPEELSEGVQLMVADEAQNLLRLSGSARWLEKVYKPFGSMRFVVVFSVQVHPDSNLHGLRPKKMWSHVMQAVKASSGQAHCGFFVCQHVKSFVWLRFFNVFLETSKLIGECSNQSVSVFLNAQGRKPAKSCC